MSKMTDRRSCLGENVLNAYVIGDLDRHKRSFVESHLSKCPYCIYKIAESEKVLNSLGIRTKIKECFMSIKNSFNIWLVLSIIAFILSFLFKTYFIQFLAMGILLGMKWITASKNTKMLVMIYEAWKSGGEKEADRILREFDSKNKRW